MIYIYIIIYYVCINSSVIWPCPKMGGLWGGAAKLWHVLGQMMLNHGILGYGYLFVDLRIPKMSDLDDKDLQCCHLLINVLLVLLA